MTLLAVGASAEPVIAERHARWAAQAAPTRLGLATATSGGAARDRTVFCLRRTGAADCPSRAGELSRATRTLDRDELR
jgi:hypothetical protein